MRRIRHFHFFHQFYFFATGFFGFSCRCADYLANQALGNTKWFLWLFLGIGKKDEIASSSVSSAAILSTTGGEKESVAFRRLPNHLAVSNMHRKETIMNVGSVNAVDGKTNDIPAVHSLHQSVRASLVSNRISAFSLPAQSMNPPVQTKERDLSVPLGEPAAETIPKPSEK